ncbi:lipase family protein [Corynebacterium timonense]|uniref:Secretory lipase n=1 Tax=Corynebacterium timonense TaxID=441500 RepID=A0A1H1L5X0_9CORY|nr:lipase family protein [Corynebacterium timonense]SDR69938.1 Secretory lipase [Corynebacterium timonense]
MLRRIRLSALAAALALALCPAPAHAHTQPLIDGLQHAQATPAGSPIAGYDPFYDDPVADLGALGTLLRTQPAPHLLNILGPDFPGYAEKILYTSTTVHGDPVATSGFVIQPATAWRGPGPTPTVVFAPGTRGSGDACAPSRGPWLTGQVDPAGPSVGINYELAAYQAAALMGARVVVVDYIGLGTPGAHTYVLHDEEGHAVLDAARAVVPAGDPVAFYGYSQGGGAVGAAAELHPTYAPEINLRGTVAGAPPADLIATIEGVDNSAIVAVLGYALAGWQSRYPVLSEVVGPYLNDRGRAFLADTADSCIVDGALRWGMTSTRQLSATGETLGEIAAREPRVRDIFAAQNLGRRAPATPILVTTGGHDDLVPTPQAVQLARDYCAAGAPAALLNEDIPPLTPGLKLGVNHALGIATQALPSMTWVAERFSGAPMASNCGQF